MIGYHAPQMRGAANARNFGMAHLPDGIDYVAFWDDDDFPSPRYVEILAGLLDDNPDAQIAACQTRHMGYILPARHANTYSRMIRRECINGHVWPEGPGGDQRWWAQFDHLKTVKTFECLYETGNADHGGERDPTGYF
jgi:glycosyltransferase involved in cell wall biosynthesis